VRKEESRKRKLERHLAKLSLDAENDVKPKKRKLTKRKGGRKGEKPRTHNLTRARTLKEKRVVVGTLM
jgi:hypothetical protein